MTAEAAGCVTHAGGHAGAGANAGTNAGARAGADASVPASADSRAGAAMDAAVMAGAPVRVAIVGAGAVGCYYGGMLARAGVPVTLVGRPQHVQAMQRDGLRISTASFDKHDMISASNRSKLALERATPTTGTASVPCRIIAWSAG